MVTDLDLVIVPKKFQGKRRTINADLAVLGYRKSHLTVNHRQVSGYKPKIKRDGASRRTIYRRLDPESLTVLAKSLFRERIRKCHPDLPGGSDIEFREAVFAYRHLTGLIAYRET